MFYESKPLEGEPDKYVNGYNLTGIGEMKNLLLEQEIDEAKQKAEQYRKETIDFLNKRLEKYKTDLDSEETLFTRYSKIVDDYKLMKKASGLDDEQQEQLFIKETIVGQIQKNSVPAYKNLIGIIEDNMLPYFINIDISVNVNDVIFFESIDNDDDDQRLVSIIEYYTKQNNISIDKNDTVGYNYRTAIRTIRYQTPEIVRQNVMKKNDASSINESLFKKNMLELPTTEPSPLKIDLVPLFVPGKIFDSSDFITENGDAYELKTVFKSEDENNKQHKKYRFFLPVKKMKELEDYKKTHPNNDVKIFWKTTEDSPSIFMNNANNMSRDDYKKGMFYLDVKAKDTLPDTLKRQVSSKGQNQYSYILEEANIDLFKTNEPDTYIKPNFTAYKKDYIKMLKPDEKSDYDMLTPMEKHKYLNSRFINDVFHSVALRNIFNNITYRDVKDKLNTRRLTKNEKSDFDLLTSTQKTQYLIKRFQDKMSHSDALKDVKTSP
jgi:hypothetical protein